jgi:AcrR family transcriptional regulator
LTTERGAKTRQQLLDAATQVFAARGFARATTKEIARAAGVAEGTIYRHFADKHELFFAAFSAKNPLTDQQFLDLPQRAGKATVRENLRRFISVLEDVERTLAPLQASVWSDAELMEALKTSAPTHDDSQARPADAWLPLTAYLEAEQALGRVRADIDCEKAAFALFAVPLAAVVLSRTSRSKSPEAELDIMGAVDVVLGGLLPRD